MQDLIQKEANVHMYFDCYQAAISEVLSKYKRAPQLLFLNCFGIKYCSEGKNIYERFYPRTAWTSGRFLHEVYGLQEKIITKKTCKSTKNMAEMMFERDGVIALVDAFECPWNPAYKKKHLFHYYLILQHEIPTGQYLCKDPYISQEIYRIDAEMLVSNILQLLIIEPSAKQPFISISAMRKIMFSDYSKVNIKKMYDCFMQDFEKIELFSELFDSENPALCTIILSTKQIEKYQRGISVLFEQLSIEKQLKMKLSYLSYQMANTWSEINKQLIKIFYKKTVIRKDVTILIDKLNLLYNFELKIYEIFHFNLGKCE